MRSRDPGGRDTEVAGIARRNSQPADSEQSMEENGRVKAEDP